MAYITREDGEHFVIPSYREVLSAKQKTVLKKDILLLSQSYGEYITLQQKSPLQYEVAFSPDTGYLLGESIWHQFKRPADMIYCEAQPGTTEAILVIVKSGSVYLDGSFPMESIPEELVIFLTQENHFEIYLYGDVPITQTPEEGKFSFEPSSVKSFTVLDKPIFPTLPLLKIYRLQLVEPVLRSHGIGVFPTKQLAGIIIAIAAIWFLWPYLFPPAPPPKKAPPPTVSPYQEYYDLLTSPAPDVEMQEFLRAYHLLTSMPGWAPKIIQYAKGQLTSLVVSTGSKTTALFEWAKLNNAVVSLKKEGFVVTIKLNLEDRKTPDTIYPLTNVIATFTDRLASVYPGNHLTLADFFNKGIYTQDEMTINLEGVSPMILSLIGQQLQGLPMSLNKISLEVTNGNLSGSIIIEALGS